MRCRRRAGFSLAARTVSPDEGGVSSTCDVAIIGSGFAGSLLALIARRLGCSVVLLEKSRHPRFVIGESSTPLADLLWLELSQRYDLPRLAPLAKWGTWRATYPQLACGLKRGFSFYHHRLGHPFAADPTRRDQLLVAASPSDVLADTHWYRPDFDQFLVHEAQAAGVEYRDQCEVTRVVPEPGGHGLHLRAAGRESMLRAGFVVDASNQRGPVARSLGLVEEPLPHLPPTQGLFTHFRGVERLEDLPVEPGVRAAPFPVDDAAVHHVFDGGWIWVLRFVNGITSAGVSSTDAVAGRFGFAEGASAWRRLLDALPTVARQFASAEPVRPFVHAPRLAFQTSPAAGERWALLPSAAGFVDPLLSSGFTLNLLGIGRLAMGLERGGPSTAAGREVLAQHARATAAERWALERFIAALYARLGDFAAFTEIARLYFCAVVHGETTRRLGRPETSGGFLLHGHPKFGPAAGEICDAARAGKPAEELRVSVEAVLREFDVAGLEDPSRRPWYPVRADDLRAHPERVGASPAEVEELLRRAGLA